MSNVGIIGITGLLTYDFILWDAWKVGHNEVINKYLELINLSVFGKIFLVFGPIMFIVGFIILVVLMFLSAKVKRWKTTIILIGLLIYGLAGSLVPI